MPTARRGLRPAITLDRGYSESDIKKVLGENLLRVMKKVEEVAEHQAGGGR